MSEVDRDDAAPSSLDDSQQLSVEQLARILGDDLARETVVQTQSRSFNCRYKGAVPVAAASMGKRLWSMFGGQVIANTDKKLKDLKEKERPVVLTFSKTGLKIEDPHEILAFETLGSITYTGLHPKNPKQFAYVANYPRLGLYYCHIITMKSKAEAGFTLERLNALLQTSRKLVISNVSESSIVDDECDDDDFDYGFEPENDAQKDIRAQIEALYGSTVGIMEVDYLNSFPITQVELAEIYKTSEEGDQLQNIVDAIVVGKHLSSPDDKKLLKKGAAKARAKKQQASNVVFMATLEGVRIIESRSREEYAYFFIKDVKLYGRASLGKESCVFALLSCDQLLQEILIHVFFTPSPEHASELALSVGRAVSAVEKVEKLQNHQPFMPIARTKGALMGTLADLEVDRNDLELVSSIGAGQFGVVFKVQQALPGNQRVTRAVKALRQGADKSDMAAFIREAEAMSLLIHRNIARLEGVCLQQQPWLIVQELVPYGDLDRVLRAGKWRNVTISLAEVHNYAIQIAAGLEYMVSQRFLHLDIAARNILLGTRNEVKLTDFGMSRRLPAGKSAMILKDVPQVATRWLAVEVMTDKCVSEKSDVWAYGITLWEICNQGDKPYEQIHFLQVEREVLKGLRPQRPDERACDDALWALMMKTWERKADKRPTFKDIHAKLIDMAEAAAKAAENAAKQEAVAAKSNRRLTRDLGKAVFTRTKLHPGGDGEDGKEQMSSFDEAFSALNL